MGRCLSWCRLALYDYITPDTGGKSLQSLFILTDTIIRGELIHHIDVAAYNLYLV